MARISKPGLDYFPLDVNFLQDRKVRRISCRHHAAGIAALTSLLCLIYKEKGYYILWNKDTLFDIAQEACCGEEEMQAIIDETVITGIQTNLGLLAQILKESSFQRLTATVNWLDDLQKQKH